MTPQLIDTYGTPQLIDTYGTQQLTSTSGTPHLMDTYGRLPVAFTRGEGVWLWDTEGKRYLDGFSGIAVTGLGHAHPRLVQAIAEQAGRIIHASNWYRNCRRTRCAIRAAGTTRTPGRPVVGAVRPGQRVLLQFRLRGQ